MRRMSLYRADQLVFLDESGLNTHLAERTHGWGPKGKKIRHQVSGQRSPNISLLPAMTQDGYIACCVREARLEGRRDRRARSRGLGKVRGDGQERGQGQWTELGIGI